LQHPVRIGRNFPIAIVEAKPAYKEPGDGLQQAKDYAEILNLKFAYSTNGHGIIEHDYTTGLETELQTFPTPDELWNRYKKNESIDDAIKDNLLQPYFHDPKKQPRYYQEISINKTVQYILQGKKRILLTLATGTGKTVIAFQIIWKLWNARWNRAGEYQRPKILYLADRGILIDDPKDKTFSPLGDARWKIEGEAKKSRDVYFSTYQMIAEDERRPGLYRQYSPDFYDLVVVDECHRGSARDDSNWRDILEYFNSAVQLGMTATPLREDNKDTYMYFGNPLYIYSLKQGIDDGFLAPYKVHRVVTDVDATGWIPVKGQKDKYGREIPNGVYSTSDFERTLSIKNRTEAVAKHLTDFLKKTDRYGKTIVFCVDQEHALQMKTALNNRNNDLVKKDPDYVVRIVSEEGQIGRMHLENFMDIEIKTPVITTTSKLLTTGVDIPTCKNIVIFRVVKSMTEFKQMIGRGTRLRDDYGKYFFNIIDYTGSATTLFSDPEFDGEPALVTEVEIDEDGEPVENTYEESGEGEESSTVEDEEEDYFVETTTELLDDSEGEHRKFYIDGKNVEIIADVVYELDINGNRLQVIKYTDYTRNNVQSMYTSAAELKSKWNDAEQRKIIIEQLEEKGITFDHLAEVMDQLDSDPFDLLCHIAYNAPLRSRRERAENVRKNQAKFFSKYGEVASQILNDIVDKYIEYGYAQLDDMNILKVPPISEQGNILEIAHHFGGISELRGALSDLQNMVYA